MDGASGRSGGTGGGVGVDDAGPEEGSAGALSINAGFEADAPGESTATPGGSALGLLPILAKKGKGRHSMKSRSFGRGLVSNDAEFSPDPACSTEELVRREPLPNGSEELSSPKLDEGWVEGVKLQTEGGHHR